MKRLGMSSSTFCQRVKKVTLFFRYRDYSVAIISENNSFSETIKNKNWTKA